MKVLAIDKLCAEIAQALFIVHFAVCCRIGIEEKEDAQSDNHGTYMNLEFLVKIKTVFTLQRV